MTPVNSRLNRYSQARVALVALAFTLIVAAFAFSSRDVSSQGGDPQRGDLEKVFSRHDRLSLDPAQVQRRVKQDGSLTLTTSRGTFEMTLTPHDLRAPGYRAEAWGDGGVRVLERGPVNTYKGVVRGSPEAQARLTIDGERVEGLIVMPNELLYIEPARRYSGAASKNDFVLYSAADVKQSAGECGNTMAEMVGQHSANTGNQTTAKGPQPEAVFGPQQQIAVALEADFEYYGAFGSSTTNVENQILTIMNGVDGIYANDLGLRFGFSVTVTGLRIWTSDTDPYTSADPSTLLNQFRTSYNSSPPAQGTGRDIAHLFTGRDLNGSTIGIAFQPGFECPLDSTQGFAYGLSQHLPGAGANVVGLSAHEIGHNLSASHVTSAQGSDCTTTIMNPSINASAFNNFCQFSKDEITTHAINERNCLAPLTQPGCTYTLSQSTQNLPLTAGGSSVNITTQAGCNWAVAEGTGWLTATNQSGTGNGTVNYTVTANDGICGARTALVSIGGQILTVTQAGKPDYLTDPATATAIAPGQTLNGDLSAADCPTGLQDQLDQPPTVRENAYMDRYKFNGIAGQKIRIEMNATTDLDTFLYLYGPDGSRVARNDDIWLPPQGSQTNSRIPCVNVTTGPCELAFFTLPQTGTYIIVATSFANGDTGGYSLTLTSEPLLLTPANPNVAAALNSITFQATSNAANTAVRVFDPFNFSADQTTRIVLFTSDLGLAQQQNPSASVLSVSAGGQQLVVENVGPTTFPGSVGSPAMNGSYIIVALKRVDGQPVVTGNPVFTVTRNGTLISNGATIAIVP